MDDYKKLDKKLFEKKCKGYKYYPVVLGAKRRIIAIGDLHGDFKLTVKVLKLANLIDNNYNWIGADTYVVQVGDQLDNHRPNKTINFKNNSNFEGVEDIKVLNYLTDLNLQANKVNGAVISLLGNHEILNVMGNFTYVSQNDIENFKYYVDTKHPEKKFLSGLEARKYAFKPGNEYSKILACTRLPAIIIGSFIFVHAGFITKFINNLKINGTDDLYKINFSLKKWLLGIIDKDYVVDIVNSKDSFFWDRILGSIPPNTNNKDIRCINNLQKVLKIFHVDKMIIGHTPQYFTNKNGINKTCDGKLYRIDFGGSFVFNQFDENYNKLGEKSSERKPQVLEILNDKDIKILEY